MGGGIDHIVHAVRELDAAAELYRRMGFTVGARNRHFWGTHNYIVQLPGTFIELLTLAELLERSDILTPGYVPPPIGLYHPDGFIYENHFTDSKTILLPDRNVASRFAQVATGLAVEEANRPIASLLAFAHFLDIEIEPSVAFHELAHKQGNIAANTELAWFRLANLYGRILHGH